LSPTLSTTSAASTLAPASSAPTTSSSSAANGTQTGNTTAPPSSGGKPRFQFDNFYSLADPYKELDQDESADFFTAISQGDVDLIERLLKVHPYLVNQSIGFFPHPTALLVAARSRHAMDTMKVLIQYGATIDKADQNGTTALHHICEQYPHPLEAVTMLAKSGADCNVRDSKKRTPMMILFTNSNLNSTKVLCETMRVLFKYGALAKVADQQYQRTPLHYAIHHCKEPMGPVIELLLKKGAEVNAQDSKKSAALHMVLERMDDADLCQMLLLYGADPSIKNGTKRNALCVAAENLRVMSAWFLLENDLMSSAPETIKKANELCSKADGPDKNSKPLFKNLLSDWHGKEGKLRRIQLAQDCIMCVQRTPDMKTIDQTQYALEFLESCGVPIYAQPTAEQQQQQQQHYNNDSRNGLSASSGNASGGAGGSPGILRLNNLRFHHNNSSVNEVGSPNGSVSSSGNNHHGGGSSINGGSPTSHHNPTNGFLNNRGHDNLNNTNNGTGIKELRLAEGVEPLKQTMLPVKTVQQLEKEREAMRNKVLMNNGMW
ncbi:hypothetical protein BGZ83_007353, partial [Gryganskiella cystojenkinii]